MAREARVAHRGLWDLDFFLLFSMGSFFNCLTDVAIFYMKVNTTSERVLIVKRYVNNQFHHILL